MSLRAASLEVDPSCALSFAMFGRGDVLAGDDDGAAAPLAETCDPVRPGGFAACAANASDVARGIDRYACSGATAMAANDVTTFANALRDSSDDFDAIASFACGERDCHAATTNFSSLIGGLSPALRNWMNLNTTALDRV